MGPGHHRRPLLAAGRLGDLLGRGPVAQDPQRPVQLTVAAFGQRPEAEVLVKALEPVKAYVESLDTAKDVEAMFVHTAAGGLHG